MIRFFEKISFNQFKKDIKNDIELYNEYILPSRKTDKSVGYDFYAIEEYIINPGEIVKIPTGYKSKFLDDEMLLLIIRSSLGFKYNIRMCNQIGVIDSDFYNNNENEGHMWVSLQNQGKEKVIIKKGEAYCQGLFVKYLTCGEEVSVKRTGWSGNPKKEGENNNE